MSFLTNNSHLIILGTAFSFEVRDAALSAASKGLIFS